MAALLNYREPQILELFKNNLWSKLYYMLYQINDLRVAVETAKRLLTKEQIDKKSGQATASPFMQTNQNNSKIKGKSEKNERKVSFSAVEAIERTTDCTERLTYLMDKMDTKLDRREDQYRPRIYQGRGRGHSYRQNNYRSKIGLIAETSSKIFIEEEETTEVVTETTGAIIKTVVGSETEIITEMGMGTIIDQIIEGMIVTKGMEVEIRTTLDLEEEIEIGVVQEKVPNPEWKSI